MVTILETNNYTELINAACEYQFKLYISGIIDLPAL